MWRIAYPGLLVIKVRYNRYIMEEAKKKEYVCNECGLRYSDKEWAGKCQVWCKEHKSCNLDIIKHALNTENKT